MQDIITFDKSFTITTSSADETVATGNRFALSLKPGDIVALYGELGSGKTTLVRGIARGLGVGDDCPITSPTFVLMNVYNGRIPVYHFDLYRLKGAEDLYSLGIEECFSGKGITLLEWAEKTEILLPESAIRLYITAVDEESREIKYAGR